jgi:hypothetical protein
MAARKPKPAKRAGKKPCPKSSAKPAKRVKQPERKALPKRPARKRKPERKIESLDVSEFPPESIVVFERSICLACVLDVFTRQLNLAPRTAHLEIQRYTPSIPELYTPTLVRPWFINDPAQDLCPYCAAPAKWHTNLRVCRIEGGKSTDNLRRQLLKSLPQSGGQFVVLEEKSTQQGAFFEWLDKISAGLFPRRFGLASRRLAPLSVAQGTQNRLESAIRSGPYHTPFAAPGSWMGDRPR